VTVAVAGSIVLAFTLAGTYRADELQHTPMMPAGVLAIESGDAEPELRDAAARRAAAALPGGKTVPMRAPLGPPPPEGEAVPGVNPDELRALYPVPENCDPTDCAGAGGPLALAGDPAVEAIVAGGPLDAEQRAALAAGKAVVFDPTLPDGKGRLRVEDARRQATRIPALVTPRDRPLPGLPSALIPPATVRERGWEVSVTRAMVTYDTGATDAELDAAAQAADDVGAYAMVERGPQEPPDALLLIAAGAAAFVTLLGVAISVALSAAEGRADLATLAAVGAPPRRRRALAAGQALMIAGLGCGLGLLLGAFIAFTGRATTGSPEFVVPWLNVLVTGVAVPLLAVLVAALLTPSRLPLARRAT
jgi:putative ABC transport system permease protein